MKTFLVVAMLGVSACGGKKVDPVDPGAGGAGAEPLYVRLGGEPAVKAVIKDFVEEQVAKDDRVNSFFVNSDIPRFEQLLFEQICAATGGGCIYTGKDMKTSHAGMNITAAQFDAVVEDLTKSLDKFGVKEAEKTELLTAIAPMKADIVTAP